MYERGGGAKNGPRRRQEGSYGPWAGRYTSVELFTRRQVSSDRRRDDTRHIRSPGGGHWPGWRTVADRSSAASHATREGPGKAAGAGRSSGKPAGATHTRGYGAPGPFPTLQLQPGWIAACAARPTAHRH